MWFLSLNQGRTHMSHVISEQFSLFDILGSYLRRWYLITSLLFCKVCELSRISSSDSGTIA